VKRGVLYIVWGDKIEPLLQRSIASVRRFYPSIPVEVVRGTEDPLRGLQQKSRMISHTPFETTLFLDADTVVLGNLDYAFDRAEEFGLACCICECPWTRRYGAIEGARAGLPVAEHLDDQRQPPAGFGVRRSGQFRAGGQGVQVQSARPAAELEFAADVPPEFFRAGEDLARSA
jgi:hypothetical protein